MLSLPDPNASMRILTRATFLLAITSSPAVAQVADIPEWVLNPPRRAGWVHAVGIGQSKIDALAYAVGDIAASVQVEMGSSRARSDATTGTTAELLDTSGQASQAVVVQRVGSIEVRSLEEKFTSVVTDSAGGKGHSITTYSKAVQLTSADSTAKIRAFQSSAREEGQDEEIVTSVSLEGDLKLFLDALSGLGARITTQETPTHYYVLIAVPARALKR